MQSHILFGLTILAMSGGLVFETPCEFVQAARKLRYDDVYEEHFQLITCIAGYRSYNTSYRQINTNNSAGYFGIFGLHSDDVKKSSCIGREPNMDDLLDDDINDDFYCLKEIILSSEINRNFYGKICIPPFVREVPCIVTSYVQGIVYDPKDKNLVQNSFAANLALMNRPDFEKPCNFVEAAKKLYLDIYEKHIHLITCIAGYRNYNTSYKLFDPETREGYFGIFGLHSTDVNKTGCIGPEPNMTNLLDDHLEDDFACMIEIILSSDLNRKFYQDKCEPNMVRNVSCAVTNYAQGFVPDPTHKNLLEKEFTAILTSSNLGREKPCEFIEAAKRLYYDDVYDKEINLITCIAGYRDYNTSYRLVDGNNVGYFGIFGLHSDDVEKSNCIGRYPNMTKLIDDDIDDDFRCMVDLILNSKLNRKFYTDICSHSMVRKVLCRVTNYVQAYVDDPLYRVVFERMYENGSRPSVELFKQHTNNGANGYESILTQWTSPFVCILLLLKNI